VWPRWLTDALTGKASLARAFWGYGVGISVGYSVIGLFIDIQNVLLTAAYVAVGLALGLFQTIALWRCAHNSRSKLLGRLVRAAMVFGFILVGIMLYVLITNASLLLAPDNRWRGP
jgi:hypothetical protein